MRCGRTSRGTRRAALPEASCRRNRILPVAGRLTVSKRSIGRDYPIVKLILINDAVETFVDDGFQAAMNRFNSASDGGTSEDTSDEERR